MRTGHRVPPAEYHGELLRTMASARLPGETTLNWLPVEHSASLLLYR